MNLKKRIKNAVAQGRGVDSAESQNLVKKELCEAPENSPASWCKKTGEASSSASADFLLEAEKRGSPPKSEKAAAFWRVGGAGRGVQPFLRKESSENNGERFAKSSAIAESSADSTNRRIYTHFLAHFHAFRPKSLFFLFVAFLFITLFALFAPIFAREKGRLGILRNYRRVGK